MAHIEFSTVHAPYWQFIHLTRLRDILKTPKGELTSTQNDICEAFGIDGAKLNDESYRNGSLTQVLNLIDQWLHHHPTLHDFYIWDQIKGLGAMLEQGSLSLLLYLILDQSPRTVIMLQRLYNGHRATLDGRLSTLMREYVEIRDLGIISGTLCPKSLGGKHIYRLLVKDEQAISKMFDNCTRHQDYFNLLGDIAVVGYPSLFERCSQF